MTLIVEDVRAKLLTVADHQPASQAELLGRLRENGAPVTTVQTTVRHALIGLVRRGKLTRSGEGHRADPYRYARPEVTL